MPIQCCHLLCVNIGVDLWPLAWKCNISISWILAAPLFSSLCRTSLALSQPARSLHVCACVIEQVKAGQAVAVWGQDNWPTCESMCVCVCVTPSSCWDRCWDSFCIYYRLKKTSSRPNTLTQTLWSLSLTQMHIQIHSQKLPIHSQANKKHLWLLTSHFWLIFLRSFAESGIWEHPNCHHLLTLMSKPVWLTFFYWSEKETFCWMFTL